MFTNHKLPFDVAALILTYVMDDPAAFVNLSSTCRLFLEAAKYLAKSPCWTRKKPFTYKLYSGQGDDYYDRRFDQVYGSWWLAGYPNPVIYDMERDPKMKLLPEDGSPSLVYWNDAENCQNFTCLLQAKHRIFNSLRLHIDHVGVFYEVFSRAIEVNRPQAETRLSFITDLEINECYIDFLSLSKLLKELPNISCLTIYCTMELSRKNLPQVYESAQKYFEKPKVLKKLRIRGWKSHGFTDAQFIYCLKYLAAEELELIASYILEPGNLREVYHVLREEEIYDSNILLDNPSEKGLTYPMVVKYIRLHSVKRVVCCYMSLPCLLLKNPNLKQLKVTCVVWRKQAQAYLKDPANLLNTEQMSRLNLIWKST